jgi:hypothetical protein
MVAYVPGNINGTSFRLFCNWHLSSNDLLTQQRIFPQRDSTGAAAAYVENSSRYQIPRMQLPAYELAKIVRMKDISHLQSLPTEPRAEQPTR